MSFNTLRWAFEVQPPDEKWLPATERVVLLVLADHADVQHTCFPSVERIGKRAGLTRRAVQAALKRLEGRGLIGRIPSPGRTSSRYWLAVGKAAAVEVPRAQAPGPTHEAPHQAQGQTDCTVHQVPSSELPNRAPRASNRAPGATNRAADAPKPIINQSGKDKRREPRAAPPPASPSTLSASEKVVAQEQPPPSKPKREPTPRGTRLRENWAPTTEEWAYAARLGLDPAAAVEDFLAHWLNQPGSKGERLRWDLEWKAACRRYVDWGRNLANGASRQTGRTQPKTGVERPATTVWNMECDAVLRGEEPMFLKISPEDVIKRMGIEGVLEHPNGPEFLRAHGFSLPDLAGERGNNSKPIIDGVAE